MSTPSRAELLAAIAGEEARLAGLKRDISAAEVRLAELRRQLQEAPAAAPVAQPATISAGGAPPDTNVAKLALFRTLFRGREDVFPRRWENARTHFAQRLQGSARHLVVLHGGMTPKERREVVSRLASIPDNEERLLIATGRYIGEGFDDARLDTLFLALPVSWKGTLIQYTGRLHRLHPGKAEVRIYDYVDSAEPVLTKMFGRRLRGYRAIGYVRDEAPLGFQETEGESGLDADDRSPGLEQEPCRQVR